MGGCQSICSKEPKKKVPEPTPSHSPQNAEEEEQMEAIDDGVLVEKNRDNYFDKEDFEKITQKFPSYKEMSQSLVISKVRPKNKKIKWKEGDIIGNGSFGKVIQGLNLQTGSIMAVKQVQIGTSNTTAQQQRIKDLEMEIELLSQFSHKNIVSYIGSQRTKTSFNIFLEYISGGTIASLVEKYGPLPETLMRVYTRQILEGLEYLHVRNTVHRDIKGANVLVDNSGICKLADFGTAKRISSIVEGETKYMPSIRGTVNWMAPEVIRQTNLGRYSDIWSVGCTVLEMATGKIPWSNLMKPGATPVAALYQIASAKSHPPIPDTLSADAIDFLKQCFKINPAERSNVITLLNHRFIAGVEVPEKPISLGGGEKLEILKKQAQTPSSARNRKPESIHLKTPENPLELSKNKSSYSKHRNSNSGLAQSESMQTFENNENAVKGLSNIIPEDEEKKSNHLRMSSRHEDFDGNRLKTEDVDPQRTKLKSLADIYGSNNKVPSKQEVPDDKYKTDKNGSSPDPLASTYETTYQAINKNSKISFTTNNNKLVPVQDGETTQRGDHSRRRSKLRPLGHTSSRQTIHSQNDDEDLDSINASALGNALRRTSKQQNELNNIQINERRRSHFGEAADINNILVNPANDENYYQNILINPPPVEEEEEQKVNPKTEEMLSPKDRVLTYRQTLGQSLKMESPGGVMGKGDDFDDEHPESDEENGNVNENDQTATPVYQYEQQSMSSATKLGTLADPMTLSQAQKNIQNGDSFKRFFSINQYGSNKARDLPFNEVPSAGFEEIEEGGNPMDTLDVARPSFHHRDNANIDAITEEDSGYVDQKRSKNQLGDTFRSSENIADENNQADHDSSLSMDQQGDVHEEKEDNPMHKYFKKGLTSARQKPTEGPTLTESTKIQQSHR